MRPGCHFFLYFNSARKYDRSDFLAGYKHAAALKEFGLVCLSAQQSKGQNMCILLLKPILKKKKRWLQEVLKTLTSLPAVRAMTDDVTVC